MSLSACALLILVVGSGSVEARLVDLTHKLNSESVHYQLFRDFKLESAVKGNQEQLAGLWVEANDVSFSEHTGTHVDAPVHTWETGIHIDEIPAEDLVGPAVVINITEGAMTDRDYALSVQDILKFEEANGRMRDRSIVFINSGGAKDYWDKNAYLGTENVDDTTNLHFPGFSAESVKWLIENRNIRGIGSDRMSFDIGHTHIHPAHIALLSKGRFGIENINNIHLLPPMGATVYVAALPFEAGSGSPARIFAVVQDEVTASAPGVPQGSVLMLISMTILLKFLA